ncbi:MAG: matrixin family metalloprotease [bacterium]|nr:matrixin family metalloprotease [bacterium]
MNNTFKKALVLTVLAVLVVGSASAYVLLSPRRTWDSNPTYIVDNRGASSISDSDGGVSAVTSAIRTWGKLNSQAGSVSGWQLGDGIPMINFRDPEHVCNGNCLAATFTGFYESRGDGTYRIYDADIVTSTKYDWTSEKESGGCSGEFYIEGVQVHEVGHGLGLGHSNVSGSTMYPSVAACDNGPASLSSDDKAGINDLYSGGGGGDPPCDLLQKGESCTADAQCCSGKCKGKGGSRTCK